MTPTCIVITAADARFFDLVAGCIQSVRDKLEGLPFVRRFSRPRLYRGAIGMAADQGRLYSTTRLGVHFPGSGTGARLPQGASRQAFFAQYFPGYDVYLWIDADAWVQDRQAVELFVQGAAKAPGIGDCSRN